MNIALHLNNRFKSVDSTVRFGKRSDALSITQMTSHADLDRLITLLQDKNKGFDTRLQEAGQLITDEDTRDALHNTTEAYIELENYFYPSVTAIMEEAAPRALGKAIRGIPDPAVRDAVIEALWAVPQEKDTQLEQLNQARLSEIEQIKAKLLAAGVPSDSINPSGLFNVTTSAANQFHKLARLAGDKAVKTIMIEKVLSHLLDAVTTIDLSNRLISDLALSHDELARKAAAENLHRLSNKADFDFYRNKLTNDTNYQVRKAAANRKNRWPEAISHRLLT